MFFAISGSVTHLRLPEGQPLHLVFGTAPRIKMRLEYADTITSPHLRPVTPGDQAAGEPSDTLLQVERIPGIEGPTFYNLPVALCTASCNKEPTRRTVPMFQRLVDGRIPEGCSFPDGWPDLDDGVRIKAGHRVPMHYMPPAFRDFAKSVRDELAQSANRAVRLIRWRYNAEMEHHPIPFRDFFFSFDERRWYSMPSELILIRNTATTEVANVAEAETEVGKLLAAGKSEPFPHVLWSEAWHQRNSNARSSVVIGVAAAEVGFKSLAMQLAPDTQWLLETIQSPPLEKMILEFLPILVDGVKLDGPRPLPLTDSNGKWTGRHAGLLRGAVNLRNEVVHREGTVVNPDRATAFLEAIADLLWIFDYYRGNEWALDHVAVATLAEWTGSGRETV